MVMGVPRETVTQPGVSIVVPVYNSEATLEGLVAGLARVLPAAAPSFEVILVDDGSRDGSWPAIATRWRRAAPWVPGIHLMRNYGQHNALLCGIRAARCEVIVTLDDDLQNPPEEIPKLLAKLAEGLRRGLRHAGARSATGSGGTSPRR